MVRPHRAGPRDRRRSARRGPKYGVGALKLALTHPYSWPEVRRGAERITVETAAALARRGHDVTLFTSGSTGGAAGRGGSTNGSTGVSSNGAGAGAARDAPARATTDGPDGVRTVRVRRVHRDPLAHERWFGLRLVPLLTRGHYDAVHSLMPRDAVAAIRARRLGGHRTVYEELGNPYRRWWASLPDRRARERVVRHVDVYGCMSRFSLSVLEAEWDRQGALIPGGVRLDEFTPAPARATEPTVLFSGAIDERRKGLGLLFEAAALLVADWPELRIWLSGAGDPGPYLAAVPTLRDHVEHLALGDVRGQGERYGRAWVTALPSVGDSFGLVLLESLACGTPIVVLDDAAPPELVTPGTGAVARPGDPASLAEALGAALALASEPATAGRCRAAAAAFDWDTGIAPRLEHLYSA